MARSWYRDDLMNDPQSEHHLNPPRYVNAKDLHSLTGIEYFEIDVDNLQSDENFKMIKKTYGYGAEAYIEMAKDKTPKYENITGMFYKEHKHSEVTVRLFVDGNGYFDVRDKNDKWIRIQVGKGFLLIVPGETYHRFTPGVDNYIKVLRLNSDNNNWTLIYRPIDDKSYTINI